MAHGSRSPTPRHRRCRLELGLALAALACTPPDGGGADAAVMDAARDAGPPAPLAVCGNGYLEPTESCDDENLEAGDGCDPRCRWEPRCGDGTLDPGEVCDDGNDQSGDGCAPDCRSDERCGNGVHEPWIGERCDGTPECDGECLARDACGDGTLEAWEACDDADLDAFDGCGPDCRPEAAFVVSELAFATADVGCDFSGDGLADNRFGLWLGAGRGPFNAFVADMIGTSSLLVLHLLGLDDALARDDDAVAVAFYDGWDGNDDPDDNTREGTPVYALDEYLPTYGRPRSALLGRIDGSRLTTDPGTTELRLRSFAPCPCDLSRRAHPLLLRRAQLSATLHASAGRVSALSDGMLCGVLPIARAAALGRVLDALQPTGCDGSETTFADLVLGGTNILGISLRPASADVDLDGDGLERFEVLRDPSRDCQPVVTACIDGDGTRFEGRDCVQRPEIADGLSMAIQLNAIAASLIGIQSAEALREQGECAACF